MMVMTIDDYNDDYDDDEIDDYHGDDDGGKCQGVPAQSCFYKNSTHCIRNEWVSYDDIDGNDNDEDVDNFFEVMELFSV